MYVTATISLTATATATENVTVEAAASTANASVMQLCAFLNPHAPTFLLVRDRRGRHFVAHLWHWQICAQRQRSLIIELPPLSVPRSATLFQLATAMHALKYAKCLPLASHRVMPMIHSQQPQPQPQPQHLTPPSLASSASPMPVFSIELAADGTLCAAHCLLGVYLCV